METNDVDSGARNGVDGVDGVVEEDLEGVDASKRDNIVAGISPGTHA